MSRDPYKLDAFVRADALALDVYRATRGFPREERYGLQSQLRRAAVSVAANLVEGCSRRSQREYQHFVSIAMGSASEARYLMTLASRLEMLDGATAAELVDRYDHVVRSLQALFGYLARRD